MNKDKINVLLRTIDNSEPSLEKSRQFSNTKRKINSICKALSLESKKYSPEITIENISSYIASSNRLDRILYSEISNYIFSLEIDQRGIFTTNIEKLLLYSLNEENNVDQDIKKIILKIYDHSQLVLYQIENANNIFINSIEESKQSLEKSVKSIEKEYITILGIFASIVFAFVGTITFSASVLENISSVSIYRLLLVIDFLAFIFINIVYILIRFISVINQNKNTFFNIKNINICCIIIALIILLGWLFDITSLPHFISQYLPW